VSHGKTSAYFPVVELLRNYFKVTVQDDQRARRAKVTGNVLTLDRSLEDALPFLFSLLSSTDGEDSPAEMDPQTRQRRTLEALKRLLLRESLNQPLMVIFEDLHWIDEETQAFLNLLADSIANARILLLVNYRPEYSHQWNSKTFYTQLRLDPLGKESATEMLQSVLGDDADLAPLKRLIIEKTEGTPFFMEETVEMLLNSGALVRNGSIRLVKPLAELKIPATVQAILASRIDRLAPDEKGLLQALAVIGRRFTFELLRRVVAEPQDDKLNRILQDLQLAEFIYQQPAARGIEYTFKHALTQEVAYNSLLIERRRLLHERAAGAIEELFADKIDDFLDQIAHHYGLSSNNRKAINFHRKAGERAARCFAYGDAVAHFRAGLELLRTHADESEGSNAELVLEIALGESLSMLRGVGSPDVGQTYERARRLSVKIGDERSLLQVLAKLAEHCDFVARLKESRELGSQILRWQKRSVNQDLWSGLTWRPPIRGL
jgi:predicted ATPase